MTVVIGVLCQDGVVLGADSMATSSAGASQIMQIQSNDKITIHSNNIAVAATGSIGYAQRLNSHIFKAAQNGRFCDTDKYDCATYISMKMLEDLQNSRAPNYSDGGFNFGALMAVAIDGRPQLVEYNSSDFQPEFKEDRIFYASIGSGQSLADPFLAFVSRVLWNDEAPTVDVGKFGVLWALQHTIRIAPGGIGGVPTIATLRQQDGEWSASKVKAADMEEGSQYTDQLEQHIKNFASNGIQNAAAQELPSLPPV